MANPGYLMRSPSNNMFKQLFLQLGTCRYRNLRIAKQCTLAQQYKGSFPSPFFQAGTSLPSSKGYGGYNLTANSIWSSIHKNSNFLPWPGEVFLLFLGKYGWWFRNPARKPVCRYGKYPPVFIGFYISKNWFSRRISELLDQCIGQTPVFRCFSHISKTYQNSPKHKILPS